MSEGTETNIRRISAQIGGLDLRISEGENLRSILLDRRGSVPPQALDG
jgi:hypothetical protein